MEIHWGKHHATYVTNVNAALKGKPTVPILDLMENAVAAGPAIRNNGGGHYNHCLFWSIMAPPEIAKEKKWPSVQFRDMMKQAFGDRPKEYQGFFVEFKDKFAALAAPGVTYGSGWVWLCVNGQRQLEIVSTPNQDNPLMKGVLPEIMYPILGLDVWEHAYYLKVRVCMAFECLLVRSQGPHLRPLRLVSKSTPHVYTEVVECGQLGSSFAELCIRSGEWERHQFLARITVGKMNTFSNCQHGLFLARICIVR
jgi:superoxide dismutase